MRLDASSNGHMRAAMLVALACVATLVAPPLACASLRPLDTAVEDGDLLASPDAPLAVERIGQAGATWVRIDMKWRDIAPPGSSRPAGFDPLNPADPNYDWSLYDREVLLVVAQGLRPLVNISAAPDWAERGSGGPKGTNRPDPVELGHFVHAAAVRYGSGFAGLPRVRAWEAWNEANLSLFLSPQRTSRRPVSPGLYRRMVRTFAEAVHGVHRDNLVIAGALAPFSDPRKLTSLAPLRFMRALLCMSKGARPRRTCKARVPFDVWSTHPYTSGGPTHSAARPDDVSLGDLYDMRAVLRAADRAGQIASRRRVQFWVTEFGWDSNPPDPKAVPIALEARWTSEALFRMWRAGIDLVSWYTLRDRPFPASRNQTGLYFMCAAGMGCDQPKPVLEAFRFPFAALRPRSGVLVWGRVPPGAPRSVTIERSDRGGWKRVSTLTAGSNGVFIERLRSARRGRYRALLPGGEISVPFPLKPAPDLDVNPFG